MYYTGSKHMYVFAQLFACTSSICLRWYTKGSIIIFFFFGRFIDFWWIRFGDSSFDRLTVRDICISVFLELLCINESWFTILAVIHLSRGIFDTSYDHLQISVSL